MKNYSNLKAVDIMAILRDYDKIVEMDVTLDELRDVVDFIVALSDETAIKRQHTDFLCSVSNYDNMCKWHEFEPSEVTEQDCEDSFYCVKWRVQELAEEVCGKPWRFLAP